MCLAIPGKVIEMKGENIIVDYGAEKRHVKNYYDDLKVGDYVIVQAKVVIKKVPKEDALKSLKLISEN